jgi:hypothetical protein
MGFTWICQVDFFLHVANGKSTMTWEWIKGIICCFGANPPQANPNHVQFHDFHGKKHINKPSNIWNNI